MTDISNWTCYYKHYHTDGNLCTSNVLYTPLVNPEGSVMCMLWDESHPYQKDNTSLTKDLVNFFFEREVKYLTRFQQFPWAAKILDLDIPNRRIFIEWNKETVNNILYDKLGRSLDHECPTWKTQMFEILSSIVKLEHYKLSLYPHCFFISKDGSLKAFDFYSTVDQEDRYIEKSKIQGMIGPQSSHRFDEVCTNGVLDLGMFFTNTLSTQLSIYWPDNPFPEFKKRLFDNV